MHILFDDAGKFLTGRVLADAEASVQAELDSGKRVKVKSANVLLRFDQPAPAALLGRAQALATEIDLDLAWEFAPEDDFGFADLARDYFSAQATLEQQVAALLRLTEAPHYFRRAGKGRFRKAPAEILQQALQAIEKKRLQQQQIDGWAADLAAGRTPEVVQQQLYRILFRPDKNAPEYKAVVQAARQTQLAPLALLQRAGAIRSAYQFHWQRFLFEHFPRGTGFGALQAPPVTDELPLAEVEAFSIDDSSTTEIDDALSVRGLGSGTVTLGIHIAAPGLAIAPGSAIDQVARARLSTVYMPGHKVTMLPDEVVQVYTLMAGGARPALSLYVRIDEASFVVQATDTRIERVPITHNLRHDQLDGLITEAWLQGEPAGDASDPADARWPEGIAALQPALAWLHRLAQALKARREQVRGKPETFNRPDYTFRLEGVAEDGPQGDERVLIGTRQRGAPLDLMVAEAMILANSSWGQMLAEAGVPGIYRSQASLAPGVKVRMGTKALPHAGIGVKSYAWSTSPLRRYTDLVNQWQIMACVRHGQTAALAAPFKPKDTELFAIISAFDAAYTAYNQFQAGMERYWTLRHIEQQGIDTIEASLLREPLVRADTLPLVFPALGTEGLPRGARVRVRLGRIDPILLEVGGTVVERLDALAGSGAAGEAGDSAEDEESLEEMAAPLAIAVDVEAEAPGEGGQGGAEAAGGGPATPTAPDASPSGAAGD